MHSITLNQNWKKVRVTLDPPQKGPSRKCKKPTFFVLVYCPSEIKRTRYRIPGTVALPYTQHFLLKNIIGWHPYPGRVRVP